MNQFMLINEEFEMKISDIYYDMQEYEIIYNNEPEYIEQELDSIYYEKGKNIMVIILIIAILYILFL